jgi:hypothetical protein
MKLVLQIAIGIIAGFIGLFLLCSICNRYDTPTTGVNLTDYLDLSVVKTEQSGQYLEITVKVTNVSKRFIESAEVSCVLIDINNREIGVETGHVVYVINGGLTPGSSKYREFIFSNITANRVKNVKFVLNNISF